MLDKASDGELIPVINLAANIKSLLSNDFYWCQFFFPELVWYSYFMIYPSYCTLLLPISMNLTDFVKKLNVNFIYYSTRIVKLNTHATFKLQKNLK